MRLRQVLQLACMFTLLHAAAISADEQTEYCGIYFTMFEASAFTECGSHETWWLNWSASSQPKEPLNSPGWYYTVVKGNLSPPGRYGHLGSYHRQLNVVRTLEFRPVDRERGCNFVVTSKSRGHDSLDSRVAKLIEKTMKRDTEQQAFKDLESLGCAAVPSIIRRMDDRRKSPYPYIALKNNSPQAFEAFRQYGPEKVVDALAAILNQLTGQHFGFIYNGGTDAERSTTVRGWQEFLCKWPANELCGKPQP